LLPCVTVSDADHHDQSERQPDGRERLAQDDAGQHCDDHRSGVQQGRGACNASARDRELVGDLEDGEEHPAAQAD